MSEMQIDRAGNIASSDSAKDVHHSTVSLTFMELLAVRLRCMQMSLSGVIMRASEARTS